MADQIQDRLAKICFISPQNACLETMNIDPGTEVIKRFHAQLN